MSELAQVRKQLRLHRLMFWGGLLTIPAGFLITLYIVLTGHLTICGSSTFSGDEIKDLSGLVNRLRQHSDPVSASLWQRFSTPEQLLLMSHQPSSPSSAQVQDIVVQTLNKILREPGFYEVKGFEYIELRGAEIRLIAYGPTGPSLARLNRLRLEDAYPMELSRIAEYRNSFGGYSVAGFCLLGCLSCGVSQLFTAHSPARRIVRALVTVMIFLFLLGLTWVALLILSHPIA